MRLPETRRGKLIAGLVLAAVALAGYVLYKKYFPALDLQQLLDDFANFLGNWTYAIVGLFAFLETGAFVGLLVPGETAMIIGGAVAGLGVINLFLLLAIAWLFAFLGDSVSFMLGRRLGRGFVIEHGPRVGVTHERFEQVEQYFEQHGGKTVLIGRFLGLIRALAPFVAGTSGMSYGAFAPYAILGSGLQVSSNIVIGYIFARSINVAADYAGLFGFILGTGIVVVVTVVLLYRRLSVAGNRVAIVTWMDSHRVTAPLVALGRRLKPQYRFLAERLTPGGAFGLEFTTLAAILAVSSFIFIAFTEVMIGNGGPTTGDMTASDFVDTIRSPWLTDLARMITRLGSSAVLLPVATVIGIVLAAKKRWYDFAVLVLSAIAIGISVDFAKEAIARPRPEGGLMTLSSYSFPSGHAAHSVFYTWLAVTVAIRIRPDMTRGAALIVAGLVLTVLIGLSRIYLGVHYLSDVTAGWALGAFWVALFATGALIVSQLRKN